ncbi:MAG TPA: hypothetical protein DCF88_11105 [Plesiomonas shigelloides]|uniref:hypothetical protein n=1 Tax=Plesiomonas shigelloides TaxID=703 RepID=UPI000EBDC007|nr:hypothetical protein [Plesiomonas shigelloides]QIY09552.1 hypothetical protein FOC33_11925 [Plesiomonas shigelloides]HAD40647.1 hypothetical protein [Plesiomonas shigelloides]
MAKSGKTAQYARRALGLLVLCAVMTGCAGYGSHTTATISSGTGYAYLYGDDDPWRYHENDWIYYYPGCCADRDELQERLQEWWQAQDPARQQAIKDHVGIGMSGILLPMFLHCSSSWTVAGIRCQRSSR